MRRLASSWGEGDNVTERSDHLLQTGVSPPTGDALCEAGSELSDAENDDFWQSVEHLKAIPIAFDGLL